MNMSIVLYAIATVLVACLYWEGWRRIYEKEIDDVRDFPTFIGYVIFTAFPFTVGVLWGLFL